MPEGLEFDQLYINGLLYHMARYPDFNKEVRIMNGYAADCISPERAARWSNPEGGYVHAIADGLGVAAINIAADETLANMQDNMFSS